MLYSPTPTQVIHAVLRIAIRDGADLIRIQRVDEPYHPYRQEYRVGAEWYEMVSPSEEIGQSLPSALSAYQPLRKQMLTGLVRSYQRFKSGSTAGKFDFAVGEQFVVEIKFQVNWRNRIVSSIELAISGNGVLGEIAEHVWQTSDDGIDC